MWFFFTESRRSSSCLVMDACHNVVVICAVYSSFLTTEILRHRYFKDKEFTGCINLRNVWVGYSAIFWREAYIFWRVRSRVLETKTPIALLVKKTSLPQTSILNQKHHFVLNVLSCVAARLFQRKIRHRKYSETLLDKMLNISGRTANMFYEAGCHRECFTGCSNNCHILNFQAFQDIRSDATHTRLLEYYLHQRWSHRQSTAW